MRFIPFWRKAQYRTYHNLRGHWAIKAHKFRLNQWKLLKTTSRLESYKTM